MKKLLRWLAAGVMAAVVLSGLVVVASYSEQQFAHLMETGEPIGDRERFSQLADDDVRALYSYLSASAKGLP